MNSANNKMPLSSGNIDDTLQHWIELLAATSRRVYYRDQSVGSLLSLIRQAREFDPTVIVELGTLSGLSLRAWLMAAPRAAIKAVDLSFDALHKSASRFPLDLTNVELIQTNILDLDFSALWGAADRVLLYVDAHDKPDVPIMRHVIDNALGRLPEGSLVIVDDLWYSDETVTKDNARELFERQVLSEIDELQSFTGCYAPYHAGGSFWGFHEVWPLLAYVNQFAVPLLFDGEAKHVSFHTRPVDAMPFDASDFEARCGMVRHSPLAGISTGSVAIDKALLKVWSLYETGFQDEGTELLLTLYNKHSGSPGMNYALAVCLARLGDGDNAMRALQEELASSAPHPNTARLNRDVEACFARHKAKPGQRRPGITFFAVPKAFTGHENIIQRNAIASWCQLEPRPEIMLIGDDEGTAEMCREFGLRHFPDIKRNDMGTPLLDDIFNTAQNVSDTEFLCYINADIIVFTDFMLAPSFAAERFDDFLLVGDRLDYDQKGLLDVTAPGWVETLKDAAARDGVLHKPSGMDYFVFRPGFWPRIPPFALGRMAWDTWLLNDALRRKANVVDCSPCINILHQNHGYNHVPGGGASFFTGKNIEQERNNALYALYGRESYGTSVLSAPFVMNKDGRILRRSWRG